MGWWREDLSLVGIRSQVSDLERGQHVRTAGQDSEGRATSPRWSFLASASFSTIDRLGSGRGGSVRATLVQARTRGRTRYPSGARRGLALLEYLGLGPVPKYDIT